MRLWMLLALLLVLLLALLLLLGLLLGFLLALLLTLGLLLGLLLVLLLALLLLLGLLLGLSLVLIILQKWPNRSKHPTKTAPRHCFMSSFGPIKMAKPLEASPKTPAMVTKIWCLGFYYGPPVVVDFQWSKSNPPSSFQERRPSETGFRLKRNTPPPWWLAGWLGGWLDGWAGWAGLDGLR